MSVPVTCAVKVVATVTDSNIAQSQTPAGAGNLTINGSAASGGVATLVSSGAAVVIITSAGDDHLKTFTIYGTDESGIPISESLAGAATGIATSALYYKTVTRIAVSAATAGAVKAGMSGVAVSRWLNFDIYSNPGNIIVSNIVTGTVNYGLEYVYGLDPLTSVVIADAAYVNGKSIDTQSAYTSPLPWVRVRLNSGSGTVTTTSIQAGPEGA